MQFVGGGGDGPAPDPARGLGDRIRALLAVQAKHGKLESQFNSEMRVLEKKYLDLYRPFFERRSAIVSGAVEPTDEEIAAGQKVEDEDRRKLIDEFGIDVAGPKEEEEYRQDGDGKQEADGDVVGIPDFWLTALKNHPRVSDLITDRDVAPLRSLTDISLCYLPEETPGFRLTFKFAENDTFSNRELLKSYYYLPESAAGGGGEAGDLHYDRAEGTEVLWKPGRDLTVSVEARRRRLAGTNETRVVKEAVPTPTFFNFFRPPPLRRRRRRLRQDDDEEENAVAATADDDDPDLEEIIEADYDLGEEFKMSIIPRAGDWFTGKALRYEQLDDLLDEDDGEEDEDEDEEE